jgi:transcriptional regulator with XRE-family HTH domain
MSEWTIGPTLKRLREQAGRSQAEQAECLSAVSGRPVTRNEVSRWENEHRLLTPYWQRHYAATFDVTEASLRQAVRAAKQRRKEPVAVVGDGDDVFRRQFLRVVS